MPFVRRFMFSGVMVSAVIVPYLMSTGTEWLNTIRSSLAGSGQAETQEASSGQSTGQVPAALGQTQPQPFHFASHLPEVHKPSNIPLEGHGNYELSEVINMQATPAWIMSRWPRVTVGLAELDLQGYRVPLVTGTRPDDLAGSLTYYFDQHQQVALIHFRGTTGDPRKLIGLMMTHYKFQPQVTGDPSLQLYQVKWNGKPISELQVHTASVLRASEPLTRFTVELALKRP
jgi:hypothetical protein